MLNGLFVAAILLSVISASITGRMQNLTGSVLSTANSAVELAIGLVGVMAFFLGLMRVAADAGLMAALARRVAPLMRALFPSIPSNSPALSAMLLNISANMMGLANAATPFGIKAMEELDKHNDKPGTATNEMVLFLAINTAGLAMLPTGIIGIRAALGSADASGIILTTWFASTCATIVGISAAFLFSRLPIFRATPQNSPPQKSSPNETKETSASVPDQMNELLSPSPFRKLLGLIFWIVLFGFLIIGILNRLENETVGDIFRSMTSFWLLPIIISGLILYGWTRRVPVYDSFIEGAKEGFQVALRIIPYLVAILVAIGMFRASGSLSMLIGFLEPLTSSIGMPPEALPMALLRPLSGSGALGVASEAMTTYGPDSLVGYMVSTYQGSTETTFYVLAVYFGAVGIKNSRHALPACLLADITGILAATFIVNIIFG
tara:strand:- start:1973 stop:3283 length:1311 start_codon:yes stop_codon:yes gene_type:complete